MLPSRSHDDIRAGFRLANEHLLDAAMNSGTGAIMVPGHMANWDLAGAWSALRYGKLTTVAERLKPHSLYDQFVAYRSQLGMQVIPSDSPDVMRQLVRTIREGGCVALLGDRDISGNGVAVQMFGATARIPGGPAALSLITGVPVHPVALSYSDGMTLGEVLPPVDIVTTGDRRADITTMTQAIADGLCTGIDRAPQDWHMLQRVWVTS